MHKTKNETFKRTAIAAALLSVCCPALAEEPQGSISVGGGGWTNDRPQGGMYDGMRDEDAYAAPGLDADVQKRDDDSGLTWGLKVRNLGLQTREIKGEVERQGDIGGSFEYSRIPYDNPYKFNTNLQGIGSTTMTVANPTIPTPGGTGRNVELGTERDRYTAKFFKSLGEGFTFRASFTKEDKDGTRNWGGRGGAPEFLVEPINSTTRQYEAVLNYARGPLQLAGGYYGTSYDNHNSLVTAFVQGLAISGTNPIFISMPLDNKSHEFFVNGGYSFTPTTRGTFKASYARATQDQHLPTADTGLASPLAPSSLNGRIDTTLVEAGLTSKPIQDLSIVANLRYRNFEDKTPVKGYVFDGGGNPTVFNTPWSYKTWTGKMDATYRLQSGYSLLGGAEYSSQDRWVPNKGTLWVPFRSDLNETTLRAGVRKAMSETVNGSLIYLHSNRDGGNYTTPNDAGEPNQDTINPFNIADRKRNKLRGVVDWAPMDNLSLQFIAEGSKDKYSGLPYGLEKGTGQSYSLDGSYQLNTDWSINAWLTLDYTKADETTVGAAPLVKDNTLKEHGTSYGVGMRGTVLEKLKVGADLERFRSENKYRQDLTGGVLNANLVPTPDITNKMLRVKAFAQYPIQKNAEIRADFIYERWQTDDWTWMMFPAAGGTTPFQYGTAQDGTTVFADQKQNSVFGGLRYIYRFE